MDLHIKNIWVSNVIRIYVRNGMCTQDSLQCIHNLTYYVTLAENWKQRDKMT